MLETPIAEAYRNPGTPLNQVDHILKEYYNQVYERGYGPRTRFLPDLEPKLIREAMKQCLQLTTAPELCMDEIATRLSRQLVKKQEGEFRRQYIAKGQCPTGKNLIAKRADTTDMSLKGIAKTASPDQILADLYAPSCAQCREFKGERTIHQTVLSSMRYLSSDLAEQLDTINDLEHERDVLVVKEKKLRIEGGEGRHAEHIKAHKGSIRRATVDLYHMIRDNSVPASFISTNVRGSQHPAISIALHAAKDYLLTIKEVADEAQVISPYSVTIVSARKWEDALDWLEEKLPALGVDIRRQRHLGRHRNDSVAQVIATYENTPLVFRVLTAEQYIADRAARLHEERQIDLIKRAQQQLPFSKVRKLLDEYGGF